MTDQTNPASPMDTEDALAPETDTAADLSALEAERDDWRDRYMRVLAESENTRKRAERDRREGELYGATRLARDLLPVHDALRRAIGAAGAQTAETAGIVEGIELTLRELHSVFSRHGISIIAPTIGETFNPETQQAMFEAPVPGTRAGSIIEVMAEGFTLHDRLLRPAQVGVSSNTAG